MDFMSENKDFQNNSSIQIFDMDNEEIEYDTSNEPEPDNEPKPNDCLSSILTSGQFSTSSMETPNSAFSQFSTPNSALFSTPNSDTITPLENINIQQSITITPLETIDDILELHTSQKEINAIQFIRNYITNDPNHIFDQYICQTINTDQHQSDQSDQTDDSIQLQTQTPVIDKSIKKEKHISWDTFDDMPIAILTPLINTPQLEQNKLIAILSTIGWNDGIHEWSIKILECDIAMQEVGVVSISDIENIKMDREGIIESENLGARAVYGNELQNDCSYYASYNNDGSERCYKNLTEDYNIGWTTGDVIRICLDLNRWRIKFYLNDQKVRKTLSLDHGYVYYPILSFSGHCNYRLMYFC